MDQQESLTQKWLRQNLDVYLNKDRVFVDINAALTTFPTLRPKSDVFTFDDGRTQLLLCIHGLLPISFRQASYNIPIAVWIIRDYPRQPPITYVVPTNEMLVKASKSIDVSGRCCNEYIKLWEKKSEVCNLLALLESLRDDFCREPPVYAKPKNEASTSHSPNSSPAQTHPSSSRTNVETRPVPPPKPAPIVQSQLVPSSSTSPSRTPIPPTPLPDGTSNAHILPLRRTDPNRYGSPGPLVVRPPEHTVTAFEATQRSIQALHPGPVPPPLPPQPSPVVPVRQPVHASPPYVSPAQHYPSVPSVSHPPELMHAIHSQSPLPAPNLLEEDVPANHLPAPISSAPVPPRPPNPQLLHLHAQVHSRLTEELVKLTQALETDAVRLRTQQSHLLAGEPAIREEMAVLEAVKSVCQTAANRVRQVTDQAEQNIAELRRKGDPEVDELVCSTTIVHNQLINLVAEDNAIEDTIYHLHRALNAGRIDLERFLRTARVLAEEQFMKRALIEKIRHGLPMISHWT